MNMIPLRMIPPGDENVDVTDEQLSITIEEETTIPLFDSEPKAATKSVTETIFSRINVWFLATIAFVMPLAFLAIPGAPMDYGKGIVFAFIALVAAMLWVVGSLRDGAITLPRGAGLWLFGLVPGSFFVSALFSPASAVSFSGLVFEVGTFGAILLLWLVAFLYSSVFGNARRTALLYYSIFASAWAVFLYQTMRLFFGSDFLDFGILTNPTFTLIGKLNDLAIFSGAMALLSLGMLQLSPLRTIGKVAWWLTLGVSLVFLALINFSQAWIVIGLFALVFLVYGLSSLWRTDAGVPRSVFSTGFPVAALILVVASAFFFMLGNSIADTTNSFTQYSQLEVRPSWGATFDIISSTLKQSPILGAGPNRFVHEWLVYKPDAINSTMFWNAEFRFGIGLIPSFIVMTGLLGALAWLMFFAWFAYAGVRSFFDGERSSSATSLSAVSFVLALYLWIMAVIYVPGMTLLALTVIATAAFFALYGESRRITFLANQKIGFVSVLFLIVFLVGTFFGVYATAQKATAYDAYQKAQTVATAGDIDSAEKLIDRALRRNPIDLYYRAKTELGIVRLRSLLSQKDGRPVEELRAEFQDMLGAAIRTAQQATEYDPTNYANWLLLARVYAAVVPVNIAGALENAQTSLNRARAENPKNPKLYLEQAQLEIVHGDTVKARETLGKALEVKSDYAEALYLLAQLDIQERKVQSAMKSLEQITLINPNNAGLHFQLGILKYSQDDHKGAAGAFARAIYLVPDYANARYFLGLSLHQIGDTKNAVVQFERVLETNSGNDEVKKILENLKAGKDPFAGFTPPPPPPEKRPGLPVKESQ